MALQEKGTNVKTVLWAAAACVLLALAGCQASQPSLSAGAAGSRVSEEAYTGAADQPARFGERRIVGDGLSITVSTPKPFTPSELAYPKSPRAVAFSITIDNNSKEMYQPTALVVKAFADGEGVKQISDAAQGYTGMVGPAEDVPPGKSLRITLAFAVPGDAVTMLLTVQPDKSLTYNIVDFSGTV
jgi:hypothetical protein